MIILDTNVLSALMLQVPDQKVAAWLDRQPSSAVWTTSITVFELRVGLELLPIGKRRAGLFADMERLLASINNRVVPFDRKSYGIR